MATKNYIKKRILIGSVSFFAVLFAMPLGHALMIWMEHFMSSNAINYSAFAMGFVGLTMVIIGVFAKGDTRQTLWGLFGGLLFWTGWVEFLYIYIAHRFGVQPLLNEAGEVVTKPEYLILPSSFGFWAMFMLLYIFSIKSGCDFFSWLQKIFFGKNRETIKIKPITHHVSIVTFMELNMILWTSYLLLLFCYDKNFIGDQNIVTTLVASGCLAGSFFMMRKLLRISQWGYAIRYAIATVVVFWTSVEVMGRRNFFKEIWVHPLAYKTEMITMFIAFVLLVAFLFFNVKPTRSAGR
ncbi:MAG: hypothetical protein LLG13_05415 [Bacteroidales bacterium]|nr:hypothetical protein [Bacteroidales bacterium]